jgi:glycogen operon protein
MSQAAWDYTEGRVLGLRRACRRPDGEVDLTFLLINGGSQDISFRLPDEPYDWVCELDTAAARVAAKPVPGPQVGVAAHGLVLLCAGVAAGGARP